MADFDYPGIATLIASLTASVVTIVTLVRQGRTDAKVADVKQNVQKIELATNSMKDALVKATREKALLEGAGTERHEQKAREALIAEGIASVQPRQQQRSEPVVEAVETNTKETVKATQRVADAIEGFEKDKP